MPIIVPPITAPAIGVYATAQDLYDLFGQTNITLWSAMDGQTALDTSKVQRALDNADNAINDAFRNVSRYAVPIPVYPTTTRWAAVIAGTWLYNNRGQADAGTENQYGPMLKAVKMEMAQYVVGLKQLSGATVAKNNPTGPVDVVV